jgi:hypothetical protein
MHSVLVRTKSDYFGRRESEVHVDEASLLHHASRLAKFFNAHAVSPKLTHCQN